MKNNNNIHTLLTDMGFVYYAIYTCYVYQKEKIRFEIFTLDYGDISGCVEHYKYIEILKTFKFDYRVIYNNSDELFLILNEEKEFKTYFRKRKIEILLNGSLTIY